MNSQFALPGNIAIHSISEDRVGEHNQCFRCEGTINGNPSVFFIKVYRSPEINLPIERDILLKLSDCDIPVPKVLFEQHDNTSCLGLTSVGGSILQDFIDPRRQRYQPSRVLNYLEKYGAMLGRIHSLPIATTPLTRQTLYTLSDSERTYLGSHPELLEWLETNVPTEKSEILAHGDFHTAHVFFDNGEVTGVIDWESTGKGWREFDLAWILRARQAFLNTPEEREAILTGYSLHGTWDDLSLSWCEVLVYLHYAFWTQGAETGYETFALDRAHSICARSQYAQQGAAANP